MFILQIYSWKRKKKTRCKISVEHSLKRYLKLEFRLWYNTAGNYHHPYPLLLLYNNNNNNTSINFILCPLKWKALTGFSNTKKREIMIVLLNKVYTKNEDMPGRPERIAFYVAQTAFRCPPPLHNSYPSLGRAWSVYLKRPRGYKCYVMSTRPKIVDFSFRSNEKCIP